MGAGDPIAPATATVTLRFCWSVIAVADGVTVTPGIAVPVTKTVVDAVAVVYKLALAASGVWAAVSVFCPPPSDVPGTANVALPLTRLMGAEV